MRKSKIALGLVAGSLLSGCAIIQSTPHEINKKTGAAPSGFTYFLPRVMMKIEASRSKVTAKIIQAASQKVTSTSSAVKAASEAESKAKQAYNDKIKSFDEAKKIANFDASVLADLKKDADRALLKYNKSKIVTLAATRLNNAAVKAFGDIATKVTDCRTVVSLTKMPIEAETSKPFVASLDHFGTRNDEWTIKSNELGLLESVNLTSEDKSGEIAVSIAELVLKAQGIGAPGIGSSGLGYVQDDSNAKVPCVAYDGNYIFDPADAKAATKINNDILANLNMNIEISSADIHGLSSITAKHAEGLYYRRPIPYQFDLSSVTPKRIIQSARVSLPNGGPVAVAPMTAGAFVTTERTALFKDGMLISNEAKRPSEIEGLLKIPAGIIKAILGVGETE